MQSLIFLAQSLDFDLGAFRFEQQAGRIQNQLIAVGLLGLVLLIIGLSLYFYFGRFPRREGMKSARIETRLRLLVTEMNLGEAEQDTLSAIANSRDPDDLIPLIESRALFEQKVNDFRARNPDHTVLRNIPKLRQRLKFGFNNIRLPFYDTRMLPVGMELICQLKQGEDDLQYESTIVEMGENEITISHPKPKGHNEFLPDVAWLYLRVGRENDANYEFECRVKEHRGNITLDHTRHITRMLFRAAVRRNMDIETQFYVIRREFASIKSAHRVQDSQYMFGGRLLDLSEGGALVEADEGKNLNDGDLLVFKFPQAHIKDDLAGTVVGGIPLESGSHRVHLQFHNMKEINRLKIARFLVTLKEQEAAAKNPPPPEESAGMEA